MTPSDRGYHVRGIDDLSTGREQNLASIADHEHFDFHEGDIRDSELLADYTMGIDSIFHQAAMVSVPGSIADPLATTETNCTGTATVLNAARTNDVEHTEVISSRV